MCISTPIPANTCGPNFMNKAELLYLLPKSSGILPECLILPIPD